MNHFERLLVVDGIALTKFWFSVTPGEQHTRFAIRQIDPVRQWKLSPTDIALLNKWDAYTEAKVTMFERTDTAEAPWTVIRSNDKKRAPGWRPCAACCAGIDYDRKDPDVVGQADPLIVGAARGHAGNGGRAAVPTPLARMQLGQLAAGLAALAVSARTPPCRLPGFRLSGRRHHWSGQAARRPARGGGHGAPPGLRGRGG